MTEQSIEQKDPLGRLALLFSLLALLPLIWVIRLITVGGYEGGEQAIALGLIWLGGIAATTLLALIFRFTQPGASSASMRYALLIAWVPLMIGVAVTILGSFVGP